MMTRPALKVMLLLGLTAIARGAEALPKYMIFDEATHQWVEAPSAPSRSASSSGPAPAARPAGYPAAPQPQPQQPRPAARRLSKREVPTVVLLGKTGNGKSALANCLIGDRQLSSFRVCCNQNDAEALRSMTVQTQATAANWNEEGLPMGVTRDQAEVLIIDTPGLADTQGRDEEFLKAMVERIKTEDKAYEGISKFLIILRYTSGFKGDGDLLRMLEIFMDAVQGNGTGVGGPAGLSGNARKQRNIEDFFKHVGFVFTDWDHDERSKLKRGVNEDDVRRQYRAVLQEQINGSKVAKACKFTMTDGVRNDIKCYFIDSLMMTTQRHHLDAPGEEECLRRYRSELVTMYNDVKQSPKYSCNDIRPVATKPKPDVHYVEVPTPAPTPSGPTGSATGTPAPRRNQDYESMDDATRSIFDSNKNVARAMVHNGVWDLPLLKGKTICCRGWTGMGHCHGVIDGYDVGEKQWIFQSGHGYSHGDRKASRLTLSTFCNVCGPYNGPATMRGRY